MLSYLKRILFISIFLFISAPAHAGYYGGHHYGYGHHGYKYYRHHYGYNHHRSYHGHYGVHARVSDTAGYVILGVLGVALLSHIFNNDRNEDKYTSNRSYPYNKTKYEPDYKHIERPVSKNNTARQYYYKESEGWEWLAKDNSNYAMDIFAIQSQQNLNSGVPKIGFAISAANKGELERAIRSMRKAIRIDANALDHLPLDKNHKPLIDSIVNNNKYDLNDEDSSFMLATLKYLQKDYEAAINTLPVNDQSISTKNLKQLIEKKLI